MSRQKGDGVDIAIRLAGIFSAVICTFTVLLVIPFTASAAVAVEQSDGSGLTSLPIEQLMNIEIEVTSASRKSQKLSETAAAVYVITDEDIHRTGATSIPDALRLAPGMDVARIDANKWAVSCRGFNDLEANKMLVLVDGRSVYTSTFSGVWWDALGVAMNDIDRIEVVRGPGATLWGANAVNAVINIITRSAGAARGLNVNTLTGGADVRGSNSFSYGGVFGNSGHYLVHASNTDYNDLLSPTGRAADDAWTQTTGGLRMDWQPAEDTSMSCQFDTYKGTDNQQFVTNLEFPEYSTALSDQVKTAGTSFLTRWNHTLSPTSDMALQVYYDYTRRLDDILYSETRYTYDLDFQRRVVTGRQEIIWGLGYRRIDDEAKGGSITFSPARRQDHLASAFVQDEVSCSDRFHVTVGSKFEHNGFTGFEMEPNVRFLWTPRQHETVWAAVSRAVRTPARVERDSTFWWDVIPNEAGGTDYVGSIGTSSFGSESLVAYELGYRCMPKPDLSFDLAAYYNDYGGLLSFRSLPPVSDGLDDYYMSNEANGMWGKVFGAELSANWRVNGNWKLIGSYSAWKADLSIDPSFGDTTSVPVFEGSSPRSQFNMRSYLDLPGNLAFDTMLYCVGPLPGRHVPGYSRLDARLGWQSPNGLEVSLTVVNAFNARHVEFGPYYGEAISATERGVTGSVSWRF